MRQVPSDADLNTDCDVNFVDYSILAKDWLKMPDMLGISTYYVATNGNNANPGTSELPWLTIQKAALTLVAGDTVIVRPGTYTGQTNTITNSGSSQGCGIGDSPITFMADPTGDVIINVGTGYGFRLQMGKVSLLSMDLKSPGLRVTEFKWTSNGSGYNVVRNCEIYGNTGDGIEIFERDDVLIENCKVYSNG